jgi:hypothetical protein
VVSRPGIEPGTPCERANGSIELPSAQVERADTPIGQDLAVWVPDRFGDPDPLFAAGNPVGELSQLGEGPGKLGSGDHWKTCQTEALAGQIFVKSLDVPVELHCPSIVIEVKVGNADVGVRHDPRTLGRIVPLHGSPLDTGDTSCRTSNQTGQFTAAARSGPSLAGGSRGIKDRRSAHYPFSSFLSSLRKRQSVPSAMIF